MTPTPDTGAGGSEHPTEDRGPTPPASIPEDLEAQLSEQDPATLRDLSEFAVRLAEHKDLEAHADEIAANERAARE